MTNDEEIQELRRSTTKHPDVSGSKTNDVSKVQHEIGAALAELEAGESSKMIGFRDEHIAALLIALEAQEQSLEEVGNQLTRSLGREQQDTFTRSQLVRLAVRVGLQQAAPKYYERLTAATIEHTRKTL